MSVLVIRHHLEDSAGLIGEVLEQDGAKLTTHLFPGDGELPPPENFQRIVVLGATWSVYDTETVGAWIGRELAWVRRADSARVPILGICFGAQVLTTAFGGTVERAPAKEIGWVMVRPESASGISAGPWFQFHGDRCIIPPEARLLASNRVGAQAFALGAHLGVQFHPEVDAGQLGRWIDSGGREEIEELGLDPERLVVETAEQEPAARQRAAVLVGRFLAGEL